MTTWFITGCSTGLGRALAEAVLAAGHDAAVTAREPRTLDDLVAAHPDRALALPLDVTDPDGWMALVAGCERLDVLVNNAGIIHVAPLLEETLEAWNGLLAVNATGTLLGMQAAIPAMRAGGGGSIGSGGFGGGGVPGCGAGGSCAGGTTV